MCPFGHGYGISEFRPYKCSAVHGPKQINADEDNDDLKFKGTRFPVPLNLDLCINQLTSPMVMLCIICFLVIIITLYKIT